MRLILANTKINLKGARGLALQANAYALRVEKLPWIPPFNPYDYISLRPGEETEIIVPVPDLPLNANIKRFRAILHVEEDPAGNENSLERTTQIKEGENELRRFTVALDLPKVPSNVTLSLDGGEVFWTYDGELIPGAYNSLPDIAHELNAYLDKLSEGTTTVLLRFLLKSDSAGRVRITFEVPEFTMIQTQTWRNSLDDTIRLDRNLQLDYNMIEELPLDPVPDETKERLTAVEIDIVGDFGPERLLGNVVIHDGKEYATVSSDFSLAQSFVLDTSVQIVGLSGFFQAHEQAELYAEIQIDNKATFRLSDQSMENLQLEGVSVDVLRKLERIKNQESLDREQFLEVIRTSIGDEQTVSYKSKIFKNAYQSGFPIAESPLTKTNLSLAPLEKDRKRNWSFMRFENPVDVLADVPYWIVIKGIQGKVQLGLAPQKDTYLRQMLLNRGGQLWKQFREKISSGVVSLLRLVYLPEVDNQSASVDVGIAGTQLFQPLDPMSEIQTIQFGDFNGIDIVRPVLIIKSHAQGTLSIANVIQEYT